MRKLYFVVLHTVCREMWIESVDVSEDNKDGNRRTPLSLDVERREQIIFESYSEDECKEFIKNKQHLVRHNTKFNEFL